MVIIAVLLICCSLPHCVSLTPLMCGENLTRPEPRTKSEVGGSLTAIDTRLPWYTSGFE